MPNDKVRIVFDDLIEIMDLIGHILNRRPAKAQKTEAQVQKICSYSLTFKARREKSATDEGDGDDLARSETAGLPGLPAR